MSKKKFTKSQLRMANDVFGNLNRFEAWTDEKINEGDFICMVNSNCEFEFDNKTGTFGNSKENCLMYCFVCRLELWDTDYSGFIPDKSNNGGAYAFATAKVVKVLEETY